MLLKVKMNFLKGISRCKIKTVPVGLMGAEQAPFGISSNRARFEKASMSLLIRQWRN